MISKPFPRGWTARHLEGLRTATRMLFGFIWGLDAVLKLIPETVFWFQERMIAIGIGQPSWLSGWFAFWLAQANSNGGVDVALVAGLEFLLALALVLGLLRKVAYIGGFALSLLVWATAEGFGGPYDPGTFDVGAGIVYAIAFLFLLVLDGALPFDPFTLDARIERRWPKWTSWAEVASALVGPRIRSVRSEKVPSPSNPIASPWGHDVPKQEDRGVRKQSPDSQSRIFSDSR